MDLPIEVWAILFIFILASMFAGGSKSKSNGRMRTDDGLDRITTERLDSHGNVLEQTTVTRPHQRQGQAQGAPGSRAQGPIRRGDMRVD